MKRILELLIIISLLLLGAVDDNDSDVIDVRSDNNFPPYEYLENDIPVGFNIEVMYAATDAVGIEINHSSDKWVILRDGIESGDIDLLTGMFQSEAREPFVDFSTPILVISHSFFAREGTTSKTIDEIKGKSIIVQRKDITWDYLVENNITEDIIEVENKEDALLLLASGRYDYALLSRVNAFYLMDLHSIDNIVEVTEDIFTLNLCFAVTEGNTELLSLINEGLTIIKGNGTYDLIYNEWFAIYDNYNSNKEILNFFLKILVPLLLFIVLVLFWTHTLRIQVKNKTKELININDHLEDLVKERTNELESTHLKLVESEKSNMFSELAIGLSHEMNTPLGNIITLSTYQNTLRTRLDEAFANSKLSKTDLNEYFAKSVSAEIEIKKSLNEITKMINVFKSLDVNNLNTVKIFNMHQLLVSVEKFVLAYASDKIINITITCDENIKITSYYDALFQVIFGIVENSILHGFSKVNDGKIDLIYNQTDELNEIIIRDNGKGMENEIKKHMFDYFFTEDRRVGTGLGLNRAHNIVHYLLNGTIDITSEIGQGTSVVIKWIQIRN